MAFVLGVQKALDQRRSAWRCRLLGSFSIPEFSTLKSTGAHPHPPSCGIPLGLEVVHKEMQFELVLLDALLRRGCTSASTGATELSHW